MIIGRYLLLPDGQWGSWSCCKYGRRDIQREKRLDEQIEAAYAEVAKDERKARVLFDAINRIANTDSRYGNQMREIAAQAFEEVTQ